jgi:small subunit ribosomal protein S6
VRTYETTFIINPQSDDAAIDRHVVAVADVIKNNGGNLLRENRLGTRRLAYMINGLAQGYYATLIFEGPIELLPSLERFYKLEDAYVRFLTVCFEGELPPEPEQAAPEAETKEPTEKAKEEKTSEREKATPEQVTEAPAAEEEAPAVAEPSAEPAAEDAGEVTGEPEAAPETVEEVPAPEPEEEVKAEPALAEETAPVAEPSEEGTEKKPADEEEML